MKISGSRVCQRGQGRLYRHLRSFRIGDGTYVSALRSVSYVVSYLHGGPDEQQRYRRMPRAALHNITTLQDTRRILWFQGHGTGFRKVVKDTIVLLIAIKHRRWLFVFLSVITLRLPKNSHFSGELLQVNHILTQRAQD